MITPGSTASSPESTRSASAAGHRAREGPLALGFAIAFIVLFLAPPFLPYKFDPYPLINWADVVDMATALILIPLYWLLFAESGVPIGRGWTIAFLVFAAAWADGHGIHLAANAIGHLLKNQAGSARDLTEFWDERFGHYVWHSAALALSGLILLKAWRDPATGGRGSWMGWAGGAVYGFALFLIGDEGGTAVLMIPFALAVAIGAGLMRLRVLASPIQAMFAGGYVLSLVLFAIWFIYWGGRLPQFSELGFIK